MTVPFWRLGYRFRSGEIPLLERRARVKAGFSWRFFHTEHRRGARVRKLLVASIHRQTGVHEYSPTRSWTLCRLNKRTKLADSTSCPMNFI